jgi:pimeloyl-ACP methyl ester carboxylesterase
VPGAHRLNEITAVILKLPDVWNNVEAARSLTIPMLWSHSRTDKTIPIDLGRKVYDAIPGSKVADVVDGFDRNAIYKDMPEAIWSPIIDSAKWP